MTTKVEELTGSYVAELGALCRRYSAALSSEVGPYVSAYILIGLLEAAKEGVIRDFREWVRQH